MSLIRPQSTSIKQWQRSKTHPDEAVFVHYRTDPDNLHAGCKECFFNIRKGAADDCINNNCTEGYYVTLIRAAQLKVETS